MPMLPIFDPASTTPVPGYIASLPLSEPARALLPGARNVRALLDLCTENSLHQDATRVMLRALPKRYAVAWACECLREDAKESPFTPAAAECLQAAEAWLIDGSEERQRAARDLAEAHGLNSAAAWVAAAAGWSGGSLSAPGFTPVPPPDSLTPDAVYAAMCVGAARVPAAFSTRLAAWLGRGLQAFAEAAA